MARNFAVLTSTQCTFLSIHTQSHLRSLILCSLRRLFNMYYQHVRYVVCAVSHFSHHNSMQKSYFRTLLDDNNVNLYMCGINSWNVEWCACTHDTLSQQFFLLCALSHIITITVITHSICRLTITLCACGSKLIRDMSKSYILHYAYAHCIVHAMQYMYICVSTQYIHLCMCVRVLYRIYRIYACALNYK